MIIITIIAGRLVRSGNGQLLLQLFPGAADGLRYSLSAATPGSQSAPLSPISDPDKLEEQSVIGGKVGYYSASSPRAWQCHSLWIMSLSLPPEHRNAIPFG